MTIASSTNKFRYEGNGSTSEFAFTGRLFNASDVVVEIITRETDALVETLVEDTDYTMTINGPENGNVQIINASKIPSSLQDIQIRRSLAKTQTVDLPTGTRFPAQAVENALDKVVAITQDLSEEVGRSVKLPVTSSLGELNFPSPVASQIVGWNSDATNLTTYSFASLSGSLDTVITSLMSGDLLQYNGTNWVNIPALVVDTADISDGAVTFAKLDPNFIGDVTTTGISATDLLIFGDVSDSNNTKVVTYTNFFKAINNLSTTTLSGSDVVGILDASDSNNPKKVTAQEIADLSSGGMVQMKQSVNASAVSTTSASAVTTGFSATLDNPVTSGSKVKITITTGVGMSGDISGDFVRLYLYRNTGGGAAALTNADAIIRLHANREIVPCTFVFYDETPGTTANQYLLYYAASTGDTAYVGRSGSDSSPVYPTTIIVEEIAFN